jgi:hypothetical protein
MVEIELDESSDTLRLEEVVLECTGRIVRG